MIFAPDIFAGQSFILQKTHFGRPAGKGKIMEKIVIALGGNALQEAGKPATAANQLEVVEKTSEYIADIIEQGYTVALAHGN